MIAENVGAFESSTLLSVVLLSLAALCVLDAALQTMHLRLDRTDYRIWTGLTVFTLLGNLMQMSLPGGIVLHYYGASFLTLAIGYSRALLSLAVILAVLHPGSELGMTLLINAVLPCWLMHILILASRRLLPPNPFIFLLGCGIFGAYAVSAVQVFTNSAWELLAGIHPESHAWGLIVGYRLLLHGGEVIFEGMVLTMLVVYLPRAVAMFDDAFYLR